MSSTFRAVERFENLGVLALLAGYNLPLLVEIGLTDLPKYGAMVPPAPQRITPLTFKDFERNSALYCSLDKWAARLLGT